MSDVYSLWSVRMHFSRSCVQKSLLSVQSTMKITISMTGWTKFRILPEAIWIRSWPHSKSLRQFFPGRIVNAAHLRRFTKLHSLSAYVRWYRKCCLCVCKLFFMPKDHIQWETGTFETGIRSFSTKIIYPSAIGSVTTCRVYGAGWLLQYHASCLPAQPDQS